MLNPKQGRGYDVSQIVCRYREALIPYYRFKEELLSIQPFVSVIYDFVSDRESEHFKFLVKNKLSRAQVFDGKRDGRVSSSRTGQLGWVEDEDSQVVREISMKIEHVTGLETSQILPDGPFYSENFQVVNYGIGGHYDYHTDATQFKGDEKTGLDRMATFLIFLNDVDIGGSTVFTDVGVAVAPRMNMALFWYNYNTTNELDQLTSHAGCPVLLGQKWIANKWIASKGNTFRRRCGLKPDASQLEIEKDMKEGYK
ncbi:Prolyl 4-hydroxylase, alpha polypeptide [Bulinus truncatus]|nr:Prolyl 4-hydroxylase, alpha polypeptide [Bulinus truncatus]